MGSDQSFENCLTEYIDTRVKRCVLSYDPRTNMIMFDIKLIDQMYSTPSKYNKLQLSYEESVKWTSYIEVCMREEIRRMCNADPRKLTVSYYDKREYGEFRGEFMIVAHV